MSCTAHDEKACDDAELIEGVRDRVESYLDTLASDHPDSWRLCEAWGDTEGPDGTEQPCLERGTKLIGEAWEVTRAIADWWDTHGDLERHPELEELIQSILGVVEIQRLAAAQPSSTTGAHPPLVVKSP